MKEFVCIICPRSCHLKVDDQGNVTGNSCPRGEAYGKQEAINPTRTLTTTVRVIGGTLPLCPVRSNKPLPKGQVIDIVREIDKLKIDAPIKLGDVILHNPDGLDADIVACRDVPKI